MNGKKKPGKKPPAKPVKGIAAAAEPGGNPLPDREPIQVELKRFAVALPMRDLFAAAALAGLLFDDPGISYSEAAGISYLHADEMMKRRGVK